ncbi:MAG: GH1 family beta-glucosidase [Actinomycetota bacterium]
MFPTDFVWGAATSAYQTEGAVGEEGRGESIWDRFCARPGAILGGDTGAVACDSYRRWREDVALVHGLGLDAYRFSVAWPRVLPDGTGRVNAAGLDHYDRFVDGLLEAGIEPFVTLYHWDLPQVLEDRGGWPERGTAGAFAEFVAVVADRLGDRVQHWITICEPRVISRLGYGSGVHAPGRANERDAVAAAHHVLLAHGLATHVLREQPGAQVGISVDLAAFASLTRSDADVAAARLLDGTQNRWFVDPLLRGSYPADVPGEPPVYAGDLETIAAPLDFLGVNYYAREYVRAGGGGRPVVVNRAEAEHTEMGWEVYPDGLYEILVRLRDEYGAPPLYVTENGAAYADERRGDRVDDPARVSYLERHVDAVARALADGVDVRGYFVWSLLDNFEWSFGYSRRFGLAYVDYGTLERRPKASYRWYRDLVAAQRPALSRR